MSVTGVDCHFNELQYCGVVRVGEFVELEVLPVHSEGVLRHVVCAYGEEVGPYGKIVGDQRCGGRLNLYTELDLASLFALIGKLSAALFEQSF